MLDYWNSFLFGKGKQGDELVFTQGKIVVCVSLARLLLGLLLGIFFHMRHCLLSDFADYTFCALLLATGYYWARKLLSHL